MDRRVSGSPDEVVFESIFVRLEFEAETSMLTMTRSREPLGTTEGELREFYDGLVGALEPFDRPSVDLLVDSRAALGRNDEAFERVQSEYRDALFGGFRSVACVLRTVAGQLQLNRYRAEVRELRVAMFDQLEDAREHLAERRERLARGGFSFGSS